MFDSGNLGDGDEAEAFSRFWDAFRSILWDPQRLQAQKSVVRSRAPVKLRALQALRWQDIMLIALVQPLAPGKYST